MRFPRWRPCIKPVAPSLGRCVAVTKQDSWDICFVPARASIPTLSPDTAPATSGEIIPSTAACSGFATILRYIRLAQRRGIGVAASRSAWCIERRPCAHGRQWPARALETLTRSPARHELAGRRPLAVIRLAWAVRQVRSTRPPRPITIEAGARHLVGAGRGEVHGPEPALLIFRRQRRARDVWRQ